MNHTYSVESPWTDYKKNKVYHLTTVSIKELDEPVLTKTGLVGKGMVATIHGYNGCVFEGHAVCCPMDEFSPLRGAKLALQRAINECSKMTKEMRTAIWNGFWATFPV